MRVAILGCGGFLAKALIKGFADEGNQFLFIGRTQPMGITPSDTFIRIDLLNENLNIEVLLSCDYIFYTAALGVQAYQEHPIYSIFRINTFLPIEIKDGLEKVGYVGVFITFGSYFEIGDSDNFLSSDESDVINSPYNLPNDYCISKKMLSTFRYHSGSKGFRNLHFILPTIYGEGEDPNRLIPYTINCLRSGIEPRFSSGNQVRQYLYVNDICEFIKYVLERRLDNVIFNIPGPDTISIKGVIELICSTFSREAKNEWFGSLERQDVKMKYLAIRNSIFPVSELPFEFKILKNYLNAN